MKNTYHVYLLKRISTFPYFLLFLGIMVGVGFLLHTYVRNNNVSVLVFVLSLLLAAALGFYLSLSAATHRVSVKIDDGFIEWSRAEKDRVPVSDIAEYELTERTVAPRSILELKLADKRVLRFFGSLPLVSRKDDFDALVRYIQNLSGQEIRDDVPSM